MQLQDLHDKSKGVSALSLFTSLENTVISIQLHQKEELKEHITKIPALLLFVLGSVRYIDENAETTHLLPGQYVEIPALLKHRLEALEDSQLILVK